MHNFDPPSNTALATDLKAPLFLSEYLGTGVTQLFLCSNLDFTVFSLCLLASSHTLCMSGLIAGKTPFYSCFWAFCPQDAGFTVRADTLSRPSKLKQALQGQKLHLAHNSARLFGLAFFLIDGSCAKCYCREQRNLKWLQCLSWDLPPILGLALDNYIGQLFSHWLP